MRLYQNKHRKKYPERFINARLQQRYALSISLRNTILEQQNYQCAICKKPFDLALGFERRVHIDHNHETKKVRGILCNKCNWALGLFDESTENLKTAIKYLERENA
jgi:DNA-directed RNA polymerase subunit RPC12/RpoP